MIEYVFYINLAIYCALAPAPQPPIKVGPFETKQACEHVREHTAHAGPACIEMAR